MKVTLVVWTLIIAFFLILYYVGLLNVVLFFVLMACIVYLLPWLVALVFSFIYIRRK